MKDIENALPKRLYFSLDNAAKLLKCTPNDLIHFGAIDKLELCAVCPKDRQIRGINRINDEVNSLFEDIRFVKINRTKLIELEIYGTTSQASFESGYELFSGKMAKYHPHQTACEKVPDKEAYLWEYRAYSLNSEAESLPIEITPESVIIEASILELFKNGTTVNTIEPLHPSKERLHDPHQNRSDKLVALNQAFQKFWMNADPADKTTHPDGDAIQKWFKEKDFGQTLAEKAATIIRPHWGAIGRRPEK